MTALPEWIGKIPCTSGKREPIESERLIRALAIAYEALETAEFNYEIDRGGEGICGKALRRIEELGRE